LTIRNSKLTLTNCLHNQLVCDSSMCKHCVCLWSEKTTVCRIFSCQRSDGGSAPKPPARSLAGARRPSSAPSLGTGVSQHSSRENLFTSAAGWVRYESCSAHC